MQEFNILNGDSLKVKLNDTFSNLLILSNEEKDFKELYKKFSQLNPIYGYEDLQVKYILKK
jgi:hypothetical protein